MCDYCGIVRLLAKMFTGRPRPGDGTLGGHDTGPAQAEPTGEADGRHRRTHSCSAVLRSRRSLRHDVGSSAWQRKDAGLPHILGDVSLRAGSPDGLPGHRGVDAKATLREPTARFPAGDRIRTDFARLSSPRRSTGRSDRVSPPSYCVTYEGPVEGRRTAADRASHRPGEALPRVSVTPAQKIHIARAGVLPVSSSQALVKYCTTQFWGTSSQSHR